ncbi:MAG: helix-turn-helix transcriptional regulator [Oscillospiraceae bacterium]
MLSELVHVNKYYMVHSFTKEYGISPINYLISRRIEESKYLLSDTDHSLSQISHMLGFSSPSYFSQSFRRLEGMSPMEFRRSSRSRAGA